MKQSSERPKWVRETLRLSPGLVSAVDRHGVRIWAEDQSGHWSFSYDGDEGRREIQGVPPPLVSETLAACDAQSAAEAPDEDGCFVDHVYGAPARIALALVGFRHDATLSKGANLPIFGLARSKPPLATGGGISRRFYRRD